MTDGSWDGFVSPNWDEPAGPVGSNWTSGNAPDGTASFPDNNYGRYNILFSENTSIQQIIFGSANPYTFTISNVTLSITGNGISTGGAAIPTFTVSTNGSLFFTGNATAANINITNNGSTSINGGITKFQNNSTANKATILDTNYGTTVFVNSSTAGQSQITDKNGGFSSFSNTSSAGTSTITELGGNSGATRSFVLFTDQSTAAQATINVIASGVVDFSASSSLQAARITNAGVINFYDHSTGGAGTIINSGTADFSQHSQGVYSIGSYSGTGMVILGSVQLISGSSDQNDIISGIIQGAAGLIHDGTGTATLSGSISGGGTGIFGGTVEVTPGGNPGSSVSFQGSGITIMPSSTGHSIAGPDDGGSQANLLNGVLASTASKGPMLKLDANNFTNTINGFAAGDGLDLAFHAFATGDHLSWAENSGNTGGTLTLLNQAGASQSVLNLSGIYTTAEFSAASDGGTGTLINSNLNNIVGTSSNDTFSAGGGGKTFNGNGGHDTIYFNGPSNEYKLTVNADTSVMAVDNGTSGDGTNQIAGVEFFQFTDQTIFVENNSNAAIALLYSAALGRTPDTGGLSGWEDLYSSQVSAAAKGQGVYVALAETPLAVNGLSIADGFIQSAEFQQAYGSLNNTQFINQLYENVLARQGQPAEVAGWLSLMQNQGYTQGMVLVGFAESTENTSNAHWLVTV